MMVEEGRVVKKKKNVINFFFQAEDGIRDKLVTGVQTCALPISTASGAAGLSATRGDHHVLPAVHHVSAGGGIAAERQLGLKQHFAGFLVEDSKGLVGSSPDEDQSARGHQGSAIIFGSRRRDAPGS